MTTVAMIAARMGSTRFPGKVLKPLGGTPMVAWVAEAADTYLVDQIWVCTTVGDQDDAIENYVHEISGKDNHIDGCWRGPEDDVLKRFAGCAQYLGLDPTDVVVRLTADCPFLDPRIIDEVITLQKHSGCVYANNVDPATYPDGLDVQAITVAALYEADTEATRLSDRNTVVEFIGRNRKRYPSRTLICPIPGLAHERWVVDTEEDYGWAAAMISELIDRYQSPNLISMLDIIAEQPSLRRTGVRNERFYAAIASQQEKPV